jgi:hypothetical protein
MSNPEKATEANRRAKGDNSFQMENPSLRMKKLVHMP